ncbi:condensation domain-containing protein [Dactylosporangium sp. NPDC000521]|uniref:condensation domain-containing protein n=1 Tax=Dactylosporangium sp. NPDC000521 TaxID=3363975 RepID=UPI003687D96F
MVVAPERLVVRFEGDGSGTGPLSWGQLENWSAIVKQGTWLPLGGVRPLPPGTTLDEVVDEVRYLMSRYQPMRTRVRTGAGGHPEQVVHASGELTVEVHDADDDTGAAGAGDMGAAGAGDMGAAGAADLVAAAVHERLRDTPMDFAAEWPVRYAVVRRGGRLTHVVLLVSHFVTDAAGAVTMMTEVAARTATPVAGLQPLAQAGWQTSPAGRRHNEHAQRHWERILRDVDPVRFPPPAEVVSPRYRQGELTSPSLPAAVRAISDRGGVESATVLLTLYAAALHNVLGVDPVVIRPITSNRFRPGLADVVCTLAQAGLFRIDVGDGPFEDLLPRAGRAAMSAYKYAYFHQAEMADLVDRVGRERGAPIELGCYFNDRRGAGPAPDAPAAFRWVAAQEAPTFEPLFVHVDDATSDGAEALRLTVYLDTAHVTPASAAAVLQAMDELASKAAAVL